MGLCGLVLGFFVALQIIKYQFLLSGVWECVIYVTEKAKIQKKI